MRLEVPVYGVAHPLCSEKVTAGSAASRQRENQIGGSALVDRTCDGLAARLTDSAAELCRLTVR